MQGRFRGRCCVDGGRGGLRGAEAFGWDECLPTVAPCPDPADATAPALRDHGEQWGRPADVEATDDRLVATWTRSRWQLRFRRAITLDGAAIDCEYELAAGGDQALPFLCRCALLALEPGSRIVVEPGGEARVTHHEGFPFAPGLETVAWPGSATALDVVRDVRARQAAKVYLDARSLTKVAAHAADGSELRFAWDRAFAPTLGIWLDYGGWPPENRATRLRSSRRRPRMTTWHRRSRRDVRDPGARRALRWTCGWR